MKAIANIFLIIAGISLVIGIISRVTLKPLGPGGIEAQAFLQFANTCLLAVIAFSTLHLFKEKS